MATRPKTHLRRVGYGDGYASTRCGRTVSIHSTRDALWLVTCASCHRAVPYAEKKWRTETGR